MTMIFKKLSVINLKLNNWEFEKPNASVVQEVWESYVELTETVQKMGIHRLPTVSDDFIKTTQRFIHIAPEVALRAN